MLKLGKKITNKAQRKLILEEIVEILDEKDHLEAQVNELLDKVMGLGCTDKEIEQFGLDKR